MCPPWGGADTPESFWDGLVLTPFRVTRDTVLVLCALVPAVVAAPGAALVRVAVQGGLLRTRGKVPDRELGALVVAVPVDAGLRADDEGSQVDDEVAVTRSCPLRRDLVTGA